MQHVEGSPNPLVEKGNHLAEEMNHLDGNYFVFTDPLVGSHQYVRDLFGDSPDRVRISSKNVENCLYI